VRVVLIIGTYYYAHVYRTVWSTEMSLCIIRMSLKLEELHQTMMKFFISASSLPKNSSVYTLMFLRSVYMEL
jgi:hypothetical protein